MKTSNSTSAVIRAALICVACDIPAARKVCVFFWDIELLWSVSNVYFHSQQSFLVIQRTITTLFAENGNHVPIAITTQRPQKAVLATQNVAFLKLK